MAISTKMGLAFDNYMVNLMSIDSRRGGFRLLSPQLQRNFSLYR